MKPMLQRDLKLFKRGLIPALLLTVLLAAALALAGFSVLRGASAGSAPVQVAVVDEEGGLVSRFCINLVSSQSYIASLMDVDRVSRKKALAGLEDGSYAAVIILPEGYTDQIMYGWEGEGEIILSNGAAASAEIVASVADLGERLLAAGQYGVFAGEEVVREAGLSDGVHGDFLDRSNRFCGRRQHLQRDGAFRGRLLRRHLAGSLPSRERAVFHRALHGRQQPFAPLPPLQRGHPPG